VAGGPAACHPGLAVAGSATSNISDGGSRMNPPIDRENLRDVLVALAVAFGLASALALFEGCTANIMPALEPTAVHLVAAQAVP
jgi:hypothetical protein